MNDFFTDDPEDEKNVFDDEEVDEFSEETLELAALGINHLKFKAFKERYPNKKVFYRGKITKFAFKWYLSICDLDMLEEIKDSLLPDGFVELVVKKVKKGVIEIRPEEGSVAQYIDENQRLLKLIEEQKEAIQNTLEITEKYKFCTNFLYELMSNKMIFKSTQVQCPDCGELFDSTEGVKDLLTDEELKTIDEIDEVVQ